MSACKLELVQPAEDPGSSSDPVPRLRVAIASQDGKSLNAHFGSARRFMIYDVGPDDARLFAMAAFDDASNESGEHNAEIDRLTPKVEALAGCNLLFVLAIGGPAAAKVISARIHPIKIAAPESIESVLAKVRAMMTGNPPPWLRKAMATAAPKTPNFADEED